MTVPYREQWKDPRWQKRRLEIMQRAAWRCEDCGNDTHTLQVHHKRYVSGRAVWEYGDRELVCLCEPCHEDQGAARKLLDEIIVALPPDGLQTITGLVAGYFAGISESNRSAIERMLARTDALVAHDHDAYERGLRAQREHHA